MKRQRRDERKAELDRKTSYITLLPTMEEGFHTGYQTRPGVVSDHNRKPHEWLESVARNLLTPGEDVGYSIPDVLAGEAQLRRLMRLPHEDAMRHQEMIDWRGALATLLLWDGWAKDDTWPILECENMLAADGGAFLDSVKAALAPERATFGLWLFTLRMERDGVPERKPLGMLSPTVALAPAANPGDLSALLPGHVRWYSRERRRFEDPCELLDEADRARLVHRLRFLQALNERRELKSPLYAKDAALCGLIDHFVGDLLAGRGSWRERLDADDSQAARELYIRALAVYGLLETGLTPGLTRREDPLLPEELRRNELLRRLAPEDAASPAGLDSPGVVTYAFHGRPFAIDSPLYLLEPANAPEERETLRRLWQEILLPLKFDGDWNRAVAKRFVELANRLTGSQGKSRGVVRLLREWSLQMAGYQESGDRSVTFRLPLQEVPATLSRLIFDLVGMPDVSVLTEAFSDCLLLCEGMFPYEDPALNEHCAVAGAENLYAVPPIGVALAQWLTAAAEESEDDLFRPRLPREAFAFEAFEDREGRKVRARLRLTRRRRVRDATFQNQIELVREYRVGAELAAGMAVPVPARTLPSVRCWPDARLARGQWTAYYVLSQQPDAAEIAVPATAGWVQGETRTAVDETPAGRQTERRWQIARTDRWPLYVALMRGRLCLGALPNDQPLYQCRREAPAAVAIDFGSNATTVMLRQGEHVRKVELPSHWLKTLLQGRAADDLLLHDELVPRETHPDEARPSTFVSVMDMFSDDERRWNAPLVDGHIYYPRDLGTLLRKNPNTLYYDLKWGDESYLTRCLRLFLKQTMLQASLAARLAGSPSVSWRISMPNAMPLYRQEAYLETVRGLAREVAAETGLPPTPGLPSVLFASENQADGLYFRGRNEVSARSGYFNMDVGGGTTDLSVWLGGAVHATLETSLLLGCRQILFDSLASRRREEFEADFAQSDEALRALVRELTRAFALGDGSLHARQKNLFLLDAFFAGHSEGVTAMMVATRAQGRVSLLESLLLLHFGFLFRLCGEMLEHCDQTVETHALLGPRMEVCVAGNGGQFLKAFEEDTRNRLFRLALSGLNDAHPVQELLLVQSRHPKQEVARGLLSQDGRLESSVQGTRDESALAAAAAPPEKRRRLLGDFLSAFYAAFPQAGERLMGGAFEHENGRAVRLRPAAEIELEAILDNEMTEGDEFAGYVRAFAAMKRLWKI